jgi:cbb3-type cytochrome oxidase subunit 1
VSLARQSPVEPLSEEKRRRQSGRQSQAQPTLLSVAVPLRFIVTGVASLLTGITLLLLWPDLLATYHYNQYIISVTHLFTLGWISSVVMGAMYQLVPVALETRLYSERLARWHFVLHIIGVTGMVIMFWFWNMRQVGSFGSLFGAGVILFAYNIGRTLARTPRWNLIAASIALGVGWLALTLLAGLFLAATKLWSITFFASLALMHAHAHIGVVGFFLMMVVGVSYKLVPMFSLSEMQSARRATTSIVLLNLGLSGAAPAILLGHSLKTVFSVITVAGLAAYGIELCAILRARKRKPLDWGMIYFLTAIGILLPVSALALVLSWPTLPLNAFTGQLENIYGLLALLGVFTLAILGMLYKIVPFLVWHARYSKQIGRGKVPTLADLYSARLQACGFALYCGGLLSVSISTLLANEQAVRWSVAPLALSLACFAVNLGKILAHLFNFERRDATVLVRQPL